MEKDQELPVVYGKADAERESLTVEEDEMDLGGQGFSEINPAE